MSEDANDLTIVNWLRQMRARPGTGMGWIRAVRIQRDMLAKQLAKKMHVSAARISVLEKDEQRGAVTLKMMQKAAEALDCTFVYAFVPKSSPRSKPRIRLDPVHLKAVKIQQVSDIEQE